MTPIYIYGLDILGGDFGTGAAPSVPPKQVEFGPVSPEQLAQLDRKLTPAEQKAVDEWQSKEADRLLAAERAKGGPTSSDVSVTSKGAVIVKDKAPSKKAAPVAAEQEGFFSRNVSGVNRPVWQVGVGVLGLLAIAGGVVLAVKE